MAVEASTRSLRASAVTSYRLDRERTEVASRDNAIAGSDTAQIALHADVAQFHAGPVDEADVNIAVSRAFLHRGYAYRQVRGPRRDGSQAQSL